MYDLLGWLPYGILPSAPEDGRPEPELIEMRLPPGQSDWMKAFRTETVETVQAWNIDIILKNFAVQAVYWHLRAVSPEHAGRRSTATEMRQWVDLTRSLASRSSLSAPVKALMLKTAEQVEGQLDWPKRHFRTLPKSINTKADADFRASANLWAMDQVLRSINATEAPGSATITTFAEFWSRTFDHQQWSGPELPFSSYDQAHKRVTRFAATIKPGHGDALMVELLEEVIRSGPLKPSDIASQSQTS